LLYYSKLLYYHKISKFLQTFLFKQQQALYADITQRSQKFSHFFTVVCVFKNNSTKTSSFIERIIFFVCGSKIKTSKIAFYCPNSYLCNSTLFPAYFRILPTSFFPYIRIYANVLIYCPNSYKTYNLQLKI
jgi:hypothetical protein